MAFNASLRDALMAEVANREAEEVAESLTALSGCMERLAQNDRRMVTLCYAERVPVPQVADAMGRSPESVYNSLRRIRYWLLDCIHHELKQAQTPPSIQYDILKEEDGS